MRHRPIERETSGSAWERYSPFITGRAKRVAELANNQPEGPLAAAPAAA